jgi:hypothetical protein
MTPAPIVVTVDPDIADRVGEAAAAGRMQAVPEAEGAA